MPQNKRRGTQRQRKGDESGSDSADERSPDGEEPSLSPEVPSEPPSRRSSNVGRLPVDTGGGGSGYPSSLPPLSALSSRIRDRDADASSAGSSVRPKDSNSGGGSGMTSGRGYFPDGEVPHIATLPQQGDAPQTPAPMSAPTLPPIRPASDLQAAQRKRAATVPGKPLRPTTSSGPKVVACNYCRSKCSAVVDKILFC